MISTLEQQIKRQHTLDSTSPGLRKDRLHNTIVGFSWILFSSTQLQCKERLPKTETSELCWKAAPSLSQRKHEGIWRQTLLECQNTAYQAFSAVSWARESCLWHRLTNVWQLRKEGLVFKMNGFVQLPQKFHPPKNVISYGTFATKHRNEVQVFSRKVGVSLTPAWKLTHNQGIRKTLL